LRAIPRELERDLPWWIKASPRYPEHLIDFDADSRILVVRAAYYLGAAFVNEHPGLSWATGRRDTAEQNMPVVTGFREQLELAPMLVAENLFLRMLGDKADPSIIDSAMEYWSSRVGHRRSRARSKR
jgi:hypothetical protein